MPIQQDGAPRRLVHLCQEVEHRGLPRTVGSEEREHFRASELQVEAVDGGHRAEAFDDTAELEDRPVCRGGFTSHGVPL